MFEMVIQPNARMPVPHHHETWDEMISVSGGMTAVEIRNIASYIIS